MSPVGLEFFFKKEDSPAGVYEHASRKEAKAQSSVNEWCYCSYSVVLCVVYYKSHVYFLVRKKGEYFLLFSMINTGLEASFVLFKKATDRKSTFKGNIQQEFIFTNQDVIFA